MENRSKLQILGEEVLEVFHHVLTPFFGIIRFFILPLQNLSVRVLLIPDLLESGFHIHLVGRRYWLFMLLIGISTGMNAQTNADEDSNSAEWKLWSTASLDIGFSKKADLSLGYLRSYALGQNMKNDFNQVSASFSYDIAKHIETKAGYILTQSPTSGKSTDRYFLRTMFRINLSDKFKWTNGVQAEKHSVNERKFDYRLIFITRLELRKRLEFLSLSPSVSYWVFYNIGGATIQYFDLEGHPTVKAAPEGMHRARLWLNLNSKISDAVAVSIYYLRQFEFNLVGQETRINVKNSVTGKIAKPYSNYNVDGITLKLNLAL